MRKLFAFIALLIAAMAVSSAPAGASTDPCETVFGRSDSAACNTTTTPTTEAPTTTVTPTTPTTEAPTTTTEAPEPAITTTTVIFAPPITAEVSDPIVTDDPEPVIETTTTLSPARLEADAVMSCQTGGIDIFVANHGEETGIVTITARGTVLADSYVLAGGDSSQFALDLGPTDEGGSITVTVIDGNGNTVLDRTIGVSCTFAAQSNSECIPAALPAAGGGTNQVSSSNDGNAACTVACGMLPLALLAGLVTRRSNLTRLQSAMTTWKGRAVVLFGGAGIVAAALTSPWLLTGGIAAIAMGVAAHRHIAARRHAAATI